MRLLVLQHSKFGNYTACLHTLIEDLYKEQGYRIEKVAGLPADGTLLQENTLLLATIAGPSIALLKPLLQLRLSTFIKKNRIDLLIQDANTVINQKKIPQLLIANNIEKLPDAKQLNRSATVLLTYSQFAMQVLVDKGFTNKILVVPPFANALFYPLNWSTKQQVKMDHAQGREYFFVHHDFKNETAILNLLKSFSGFKKWQHSGMKLIIAGNIYMPPADWNEKLATYKYRDDVVVYKKLQERELAKLYAAAYTFIHLPETDNDILPLLQAVQCHTPVIAWEMASVKEYGATAALMAATEDYEELTQKMILLYKDETLRNRLIAANALQADELTRQHAADTIQTALQEILPPHTTA